MFKRKDDIRTFIVIMSVCFICVIIALILSYKTNYDKLANVDEYNVYFSNVNYVNNFINKIALKDNDAVYSLLDKNYIDEREINVNDVLDYFDDYSIHCSFGVNDMYFVQIKNNFIYYIEGQIYEIGYDTKSEIVDDEFNVVICIDINNKSYSIYPTNDNYKDIINSIGKVNVIENDDNGIVQGSLINKEQICALYLSDFTNSLFDDVNSSYLLLSDDMKKIYTTVDSYVNYIRDNLDVISSTADKCNVDELDNKRVYTVIDNNQNTYVFTENSVMDYTVDFYLKKISE